MFLYFACLANTQQDKEILKAGFPWSLPPITLRSDRETL